MGKDVVKGFFTDIRQAKSKCRQTIASDPVPEEKTPELPPLPAIPEVLKFLLDIPAEKFASNIQNKFQNLASNISCVLKLLDFVSFISYLITRIITLIMTNIRIEQIGADGQPNPDGLKARITGLAIDDGLKTDLSSAVDSCKTLSVIFYF